MAKVVKARAASVLHAPCLALRAAGRLSDIGAGDLGAGPKTVLSSRGPGLQ